MGTPSKERIAGYTPGQNNKGAFARVGIARTCLNRRTHNWIKRHANVDLDEDTDKRHCLCSKWVALALLLRCCTSFNGRTLGCGPSSCRFKSGGTTQFQFPFRRFGVRVPNPPQSEYDRSPVNNAREWWNRNYRSAYWEDGAIDRFKEARRIG